MVLLVLVAFNGQAQKIDVRYYALAFPNESYVCLDKTEKAELKIVKNRIQIIQHHHEKLLILKNNLNATRSRKVRTNAFIRVANLSANILVYDGKNHSRKKITDFELASENDNDGNFYDAAKYYTVNFRFAKEGDIIEIDYDDEFIEPRFFGAFFTADYSPQIHSEFTISYPQDQINIKVKEINGQHLPLLMKTTINKKVKTLTWSFDSIPPLTNEYADAGYRCKTSGILANVESYTTGDSLIKIGGTLENLYKWYRYLLKNVDVSKNDQLIKLTDSLVKNQVEDIEKLKKIFYWVQDKIAYLAYEDGLGGYIPREASVVCERRFGDCKDMANLIVKMCRLANLPVFHAWIGTRDIPYQFSEFPSPFCANHMIAAYISKNDTIFLDATGKKHPFRLPTQMIQGKEALIGIDSVKYIIAKVPFIKKDFTIENDSINLSILPNNQMSGSGYYTLTGYQKINLLNYLEKKSYETQKKYMRDILEKGNNKFKLDTFMVLQQDIEKPLIIAYKFVISDYFTQTGDLIYINLNFLKDYYDWLNLTKRKNNIDFAYRTINRLCVKVNLEGKYRVDFLPQNASFDNEDFGFTLSYSSNINEIIFRNSISINKTTISTPDFKSADFIVSNYKKNKSNLVSLIIKK